MAYCPLSLFFAFAGTWTAVRGAQSGSCPSGCPSDPVSGFVRRQGEVLVGDDGETFRFVSINVPNLHRIEEDGAIAVPTGAVSFALGNVTARVPTEVEVRDALCSVRQLGAKATRLHVLSHGDTDAFHVGPGGELNEVWFQALDMVVAAAHDLGVRLIIPFVDTLFTEVWGSTRSYATWVNESESQFFHSEKQRDLFKAVLGRVLRRNNTVTGKIYADEEAILAWELGNDLFDVTYGSLAASIPAPTEWTSDIAQFMKAIDGNHLLMDGSQFTLSSLGVVDIDIVGSIFRGKTAIDAHEELSALEMHNQAVSEEEMKKSYIVKAFGLVESESWLPTQNFALVSDMLEVVHLHEHVVAGAMYSSLSYHAHEGGFYHHKQANGVADLHWPGFVSGAPTYEVEVLGLLAEAAKNATGDSATILKQPCPPDLLLEAYAGVMQGGACLPFRGSAGAVQYELWAASGTGDVEEDWRLILEGISDETTAQNAVVSVDDDSLQLIFGDEGTDGSQTYSFCLRACADRGHLRDRNRLDYRRLVPESCSNCSEFVRVVVAWGGFLDCTASAGGELRNYGEEFSLDAWEAGYYNYGQAPPEIKSVLVVLGAVGALVLVDLLSRRGHGGSQTATPAESVSQLRGDSGSRAGVVDLLRFAAVLHLVLYLGAKYKWFGSLPDVVNGLAAWGVVEFPFLFLHAGFIAGVRYTPRACDMDVWPFVWRALARSYPVFLIFAAASLIYAALWLGLPITGRHIWIFPFNLHAWNAELQFSDMTGEVSWVLGPLLVHRAFSLPLLSRLQEISKSALFTILVAAFALTLWQAVYYREVRVFVLDDVVTWLALRAYGPSFVMGAAMGALFGRHYGEEGVEMQSIGKVKEECQTSRTVALRSASLLVLERFGVSFSVIILVMLGALVSGPDSLSGWPLAQTWVGHGLTLPLQASMLWAAAAGTDPLAAAVLHRLARLFTLLQSWFWLYALVAGPLTQALTTLIEQAEYSPGGRILLFGAVLLVVASLIEIGIRQPLIVWAARKVPSASKMGLLPGWAEAPNTKELLFLYYAGLATVLVTFAWYALEEDSVWISVVDIPDGPAANVFLVVTYMLYVPAWALGMGLMGMVMYPPILDRKPAPIKRQLQEDHLEDKSPFRIAFRIVTRGNSPNLVKANVCVAHEVLDSCDLPKDRWLLEVVTDSKMDLETLGLPVAELVVPKLFKPPGGCMFKARALQFAVGASSATREDWVVHLDEETRFDAETVAAILEHCREQQAAWESERQPYPHIGQGVIVYNTTCQENLLCTLADTIRVSDDFGKFAVQYRLAEQPLIGMHGSFVVCPNSVEIDVGFDWGLAGSITEDTFFALKAAGDGIHVKWCGGFMFEQSPFGVHDFAKQRCRWFAGLWLCVRDCRLPLLHRVVLGTHVISWALCPFLTILAWTNWLCRMTRPGWMRASLALIYAIPLWGYLLGFFWTFAMSTLRHGPAEYLMLLFMQIMGVPIYALMEAYGIARALWTRPFKKFQLVQKEGKLATGGASSAAAAAAAAAEGCDETTKEAIEQMAEADEVDKEEAADSRLARSHSFKLHKHPRNSSSIMPSGAPGHGGADPERGFWHRMLVDAPCMLQVPSTCAVPVTPRPGKKRAALPEGSADALLKLAAASAQGTSVLDIAGAAFAVVLATHCQEEDFVLGAHAHLSRPARFEEEAVMLPVRVVVNFDKSLPELSRVFSERRQSCELTHRQDGFPSLGSILCQGGESWTEWAASSRPAFCFGVAAANKQPLPQAEVVMRVSTSDQARAEGFTEAVLEFSTNVYDEGVLLQLCSRIGQLLISASADPQQPLCGVPILTDAEARAVADFCVGQAKPYRKQPLHELFLAQAELTPEAVAATHWSTSITYGGLSAAVQRVAAGVCFLIGGNVRAHTGNVLVGLLFERTVDSLAVVYGVVAAGAAYLPMDPDFPTTRIKDILLDARETCPLVLVEGEELALKVPTDYPGKVACASCEGVKLPGGIVAPATGTRGTGSVAPDSMVYCMYTSGTTGRPKGVMVDHNSLSIRVDWFQTEFGISAADRLIFKTPYIFGISEWEIFWPLTCGASLAVAPKEAVRSLTLLTELMQSQQVSHAFFVPSHLGALLRHWRSLPTLGLRKTLRWIGCCGEPLPEQTIMDTYRVLPRADLHNIYGPTEGSMTWRQCEWQDASETATLIGKPIDNTVVVLLDRWQRVVPVGVPGEICFGHCVAKGYLNKPGLTKEKFVPSQLPEGFLPTGAPECPLLYHTGDLAIWLETGELKYVGRADRQVKVRGFRIELGAVEVAMREAAALASARLKQQQPLVCSVALPPEAGRPGGELVGFIETALSRAEMEEVRRHMSELLPSYMVPTRLIAKNAFETLPSGKVNVKALQREAAGEPGAEAGTALPGEATKVEDSLGQLRRLMGSTSSRAMEDRVADNLRAFFMYGVIFDHWVGCSESTMCQLVVDGMIWQQAPGVQRGLVNLEVVLRSLGNYKTMSGFIMLSAYLDSAYADAASFAKRDLVALLAYLQLLWVCDPIIWAVCRSGEPDMCTDTTNQYAGVHRWYLLVLLVLKVALVFFRVTRIPPLAQCALFTGLAFCMPSEVGCFTEEKCMAMHDSEFWIENFALLGPVWRLLFRGSADDPYGMSTSAFMRYYVFFMALYFWTFHYGRTVVAKAVEALQFFAPSPGNSNCNRWWSVMRSVALLLFVLLELCSSAIVGPTLYGLMQGNAFGTFEPRLLPLLMVAVLFVVEIALLAFAVSAVPWRLKLLGSTTLGCYMIHVYFTYPIVILREHFDSLGHFGGGGLVLQLLIILVAPLLFQATFGALFHKLFMLEVASLFWVAAWFQQHISHSFQRLLKSMGLRQIDEMRDVCDLELTPASAGGSAAWDAWKPDASVNLSSGVADQHAPKSANELTLTDITMHFEGTHADDHDAVLNASTHAAQQKHTPNNTFRLFGCWPARKGLML